MFLVSTKNSGQTKEAIANLQLIMGKQNEKRRGTTAAAMRARVRRLFKRGVTSQGMRMARIGASSRAPSWEEIAEMERLERRREGER